MNAGRSGLPLVAIVAVALGALPVAGGDVTGYVQFRLVETDADESAQGLLTTANDTQTVESEIQLSFNQQASPLFRFWGGGTFEDFDVSRTALDGDFDTDGRRLRPYFGIGRRGSRWLSQLSWSRDERRQRTVETATSVREGYFGALARTPKKDHGVRMRMSFSRNHDYRVERPVPDTVSDFADLEIGQNLGARFRWSYRGTLSASDDRAEGSDTRTLSHNADLRYSDEWFDRRVVLQSEYSVNYRDTRIRAGGSGVVDLPLFPLDGLVARDTTPLEGALDPAPPLVDDNLETPTSIDLGLAAPGDDDPWSLGLEFVLTTTLNTFFVYVDRELEPEVAAAFSWQIYSSPNNTQWTLRQIVTGAPYDEFLRRFEIRFADLSVRYIKLVVRPLGPDVPGATEFPDLFVTELDAVQRVPAPSGRLESTDTLQRMNIGARVRLLAHREFFLLSDLDVSDSEGRRPDYRSSNGLYFTHPLAANATLTTRVAWDESRDETGSDSALAYSAALQLRPVERLSYNLSLSGREEGQADEIGGDQISLFLYATADLFDGFYLQLGARRSHLENARGVDVPSTQIDFGARIEPRNDLLLLLNYTDSVSDSAVDASLPEIFTRAAESRLTYTPVPTIYLYGSYRLEWRSGQDRDTVRSTAVSWAPFPGATFRLGLNYNETRRNLFDDRERVVGSTLRWNLNPRSYFELAYTDIRDQNSTRTFENQNASAILRWGF